VHVEELLQTWADPALWVHHVDILLSVADSSSLNASSSFRIQDVAQQQLGTDSLTVSMEAPSARRRRRRRRRRRNILKMHFGL